MFRGLAVAAIVVAPACAYQSYTPPARMLPLETAHAPAAGHSDLQLGASSASAIMGFSVLTGGGRLRHAVSDNVAVDGEAAMIQVQGKTTPDVDHEAYVGRLGVHVHPGPTNPGCDHIAFVGGAGSGYSALAGRWVSYDAGVVVSTRSTYADLFLGLTGFGSTPLRPQPFQYQAAGDDKPQTDVLSQTWGWGFIVGLDLHTPDDAFAVTLGLRAGSLTDDDHRDTYGQPSLAMRWSLD